MTEQDPSLYTCANGVVLKLKPVSPYLRDQLLRNLPPRPRPPRQFLESKGREEENPAHPDYLVALEEYANKLADTSTNVLLTLGVEVASVPEGFERPEDEGWAEEVAWLGVEVPPVTEPRHRKLVWLKFWCLASADDARAIQERQRRLNGVPEEAVTQAAESFPGGEGRGADLGARDPAQS